MNGFIASAKSYPLRTISRFRRAFDALEFTQWTNSFGTTFWDTSLKLLAGFHGVDWKKLKQREDNKELLRSFFWANTNSVERFDATPSKNKVPVETWRTLKKASEEHLDSFETLVNIFSPNVVVIMNWDAGNRFMDTLLNWEIFGDHLAYALHPAGRTHVFKTAHPTWLNQNRLHGFAIENIIKKANQLGVTAAEQGGRTGGEAGECGRVSGGRSSLGK